MRTSMVAFELKSAQWDAQLPLFQEGRPFSAFGAESQLSSRHDAWDTFRAYITYPIYDFAAVATAPFASQNNLHPD